MTPKTKQEIIDWFSAYILKTYRVEWRGGNAGLADFGIDSVSMVELVCAVDDWLDIAVPSNLLSEVADTDGLIAALEALQKPDAGKAAVDNDYKTYVNPYLAAKLEQLKIDRMFVRSEGCYLFDKEGRRYIDFMAQYGALPFGHHPKEIWQAITDLRDDSEPVFAQPSIPLSSARLARRLIALAPKGLRYVTFSNSGTEAVEAALKMARHATGRLGIVATGHGFHGKTFGALSATGNLDYQVHFGLPLPDFDHVKFGDVPSLEKLLAARPENYAAFIVESIQGEGGVHVAPQGYLREAKSICERYGVLLIVDEVQTGLGRTGAMFSCEDEGVSPDIITLAKALGGGIVPIGATLCTEAVYSEKFALKHSSTFAGNALAARAGLATLDLLTQDSCALLQHVRTEGERLRHRLEEIRKRHPWLVKEIRGRGFMLGIRFTAERSSWQENFLGIAAEERQLAQFVSSYLLNVEGVRLAPTLNGGDVLRVQPPLNATREQCDAVADALSRTIDTLALRQTGNFYRAILRREASAVVMQEEMQKTTVQSETKPSESVHRFAFLLHPLDENGYADYDPSLSALDPDELREFSASMEGLLDPVVGTTINIESNSGARAQGDFIMISHTAEQLKNMPQRDALAVLNKGLTLARARGASIVGLGAYTSVVSAGGSKLASPSIALTSGNSYTVVSGIEALDAAMQRSGKNWSDNAACIVGAAGAIGSCMAMLIAERARRVVLIGNPVHEAAIGRERLLATARALVSHVLTVPAQDRLPSSLASFIADEFEKGVTSIDSLLEAAEKSGNLILTSSIHLVAMANVVVTATSFPGQLIDDDVVRPGAIICDISRPRSIHESIAKRRPDVLVIDGGIVALPGSPRVGPYGVEDGTSYACMAETMLLALEGHFKDTSLGASLDMMEVKRQQVLARKHGFSLSGLQSFGRPLPTTV